MSEYNLAEKFDQNCEECVSLKQKLADFGAGYLDNIMTQEQALAEASRNIEWDCDARQMVEFITNNPI